MMKFSKIIVAAAALSVMATPAAARDPLEALLAGESHLQGEKLEKAIEKAAEHPFGSNENPVRAHKPQGQRAYLSRLRCPDGSPLQFRRQGNVGIGPYQNIVDKYQTRCNSDDNTIGVIFMDMYHKGYVESEAVPGFTIEPVVTEPASSAE